MQVQKEPKFVVDKKKKKKKKKLPVHLNWNCEITFEDSFPKAFQFLPPLLQIESNIK